MKETRTAEQAWAEIVQEAQDKALNSPRIVHVMQVGQVIRQGDIYIHCVSADHPMGEELKTRQLAIGETQGSRHVAEKPSEVYAGVTLPDWCEARTFLGPVVFSPRGFTITHPEHAHVELPPGKYQITHQMDARTGERVKD